MNTLNSEPNKKNNDNVHSEDKINKLCLDEKTCELEPLSLMVEHNPESEPISLQDLMKKKTPTGILNHIVKPSVSKSVTPTNTFLQEQLKAQSAARKEHLTSTVSDPGTMKRQKMN